MKKHSLTHYKSRPLFRSLSTTGKRLSYKGLRLSALEWDRIQHAASLKTITTSDLMRDAIAEYLEKHWPANSPLPKGENYKERDTQRAKVA